jgi:hypothetical protein
MRPNARGLWFLSVIDSLCNNVSHLVLVIRCIEQSLQCERGNKFYSYPIQYGLKYCRAFRDMKFKQYPGSSDVKLFHSPDVWRLATMNCLQSSIQRFLQSNPKPTCQVFVSFFLLHVIRCVMKYFAGLLVGFDSLMLFFVDLFGSLIVGLYR